MAENNSILSVAEFCDSVVAPRKGGVTFILQINPRDKLGRKLSPEDPQYGELDTDAIIETMDLAKSNFAKMINGVPNPAKNLRIRFFASGSELKEPAKSKGTGHHRRAKEGAMLTWSGAEEVLRTMEIPAEKVLLDMGEREVVHTPTAFNDIDITPEFEKFLIEQAKKLKSDNWSLDFWTALEEDKYPKERKAMGTPGPSDIASRVNHFLTLIARSHEYLFHENPDTHLIIHVTMMYDILSPYLRKTFGMNWTPMEKNAGVVLDYSRKADRFKMCTKRMDNISAAAWRAPIAQDKQK